MLHRQGLECRQKRQLEATWHVLYDSHMLLSVNTAAHWLVSKQTARCVEHIHEQRKNVTAGQNTMQPILTACTSRDIPCDSKPDRRCVRLAVVDELPDATELESIAFPPSDTNINILPCTGFAASKEAAF